MLPAFFPSRSFLSATLLLFFAMILGAASTWANEETGSARQLYQQASKLQNAGKFAEALVSWRRLIRAHGDDPLAARAYEGLGTCLLETGELVAAVQAFDQALARLPRGESSGTIRWNRAVALYRTAARSKKPDDYRDAEKSLRAAAGDVRAPRERRSVATFYLARTEQAQGKKELAQRHYRQMLDPRGDKELVPHALLALASLAEETEDWAEAARVYESFLHDHPNHSSADVARLGLADALLNTGKYAAAETQFGQIQARAKFAAADYALFRWGEAAMLQGRPGEAADRLEQLLQRYPKTSYRKRALALAGEAQLQAARTLAEKKEFGEALRRCRSVLDAQTDAPEAPILYLAGYCSLKLGKLEDAAKLFRAVVEKHPRFAQAPAACYSMAAVLEAQGARDRAIAAYQRLLKDYPNDPLAAKAKQRVEVLQANR